MPNLAYRPIGVSGATTSVPQTAVSSGARYMALVGRSGKGPDVPTLFQNVQSAYAAYGSPGAAGELPWGIASAMGVTLVGVPPAPCIICRVGVTRASLILLDTSVTWATLSAKGQYAGTAGNGVNTPTPGLYAQVLTGSLAGTKKLVMTQGTGGTAVTLSTYDNLKLPGDLYGAAANDPYIDVAPGASLLVPATVASTPLAGGTDGLSAAPTGSPDPWATQLSLLFSGIVPVPRYFCCLYDATAIWPDCLAAINAALANTPVPTPAMAYLGSTLGTSIATNATLASNTINQIQAVLWGMPGGMRRDPLQNNNPRGFDGYYQAASLMGMKASQSPQFAGLRSALPGWEGNMAIPTSTGISRQPTVTDVIPLGQNGAAFGLSGAGYRGLEVTEHLTTGQVYGTNFAWQQYANMLDSHHHAQEATYTASNNLAGQPAATGSSLSTTIQDNIHAALKQITGTVLSKVNSVSAPADPSTVGRYLPAVSYDLAPSVRNIDVTFAIGTTS